MRRRKHILQQYLKYSKHIDYVRRRTLELRSKLCKEACLLGTVDETGKGIFFSGAVKTAELAARYAGRS